MVKLKAVMQPCQQYLVHSVPRQAHLACFAQLRSCDSFSRGWSCTVNAQLFPSPFSAHAPQCPCESGKVCLQPFEEEEEKSGCVRLHFCTGLGERYLRAWFIGRKKLMLVPTSARGCRWRAWCSTFHCFQTDGKGSFSSRALLLLLPSLHSSLLQQSPLITAWRRTLSSFSQNPWSDVYRKQFLEACNISLFCTVSLYEETQDLVQNENPSVGTNVICRANMDPASCHGPNSFLLQLQWHPWNYSGRISDAYSHITKWLFMRMCY